MNAIYQLKAELSDLDGWFPGGREFERRFLSAKQGPTHTYVFRDEGDLAQAQAFLRQRGLRSQRYYVFELSDAELRTYPAVYLGIENLDDLFLPDELEGGRQIVDDENIKHIELARDYGSERIVASPRVKVIIDTAASGVTWKLVGGTDVRDWYIMNVNEVLPDPIVVPTPVEIGANVEPPGTYAVRSDGREVISERNVAYLARVELALSHTVQIPSGVLRWRPTLVASGVLAHALKAAKVGGLLTPFVPLLKVCQLREL